MANSYQKKGKEFGFVQADKFPWLLEWRVGCISLVELMPDVRLKVRRWQVIGKKSLSLKP